MKCLSAHCRREAIVRGLCRSCYVILRKHVRQRRTTYEQAILEGRILPANSQGSAPKGQDVRTREREARERKHRVEELKRRFPWVFLGGGLGEPPDSLAELLVKRRRAGKPSPQEGRG
ncbi:MAG: hypothetical protein ACOY3P_10750 [Planctomycetota bacterium]